MTSFTKFNEIAQSFSVLLPIPNVQLVFKYVN